MVGSRIWGRHEGDDSARDAEYSRFVELPLTGNPPGRGTPGLVMSGPKGSTFVGKQLVDYGQLTAAMKTVS